MGVYNELVARNVDSLPKLEIAELLLEAAQ